MKQIYIVAGVAIVLIAVFLLLLYPFNADAEILKLDSIFKKYSANLSSGNFYEHLDYLSLTELALLKSELESFRTFFFVGKPAKVAELTDIYISFVELSANVKEIGEIDDELFANFTEPCSQVENLQRRNNLEAGTVSLLSSLPKQVNDYSAKYSVGFSGFGSIEGMSDVIAEYQAHKDSLAALEASCGELA